jgi:hypothetical protein
MLSHRDLVASTLQMSIPFRIGHEEAMILVLPLFHIYGLSVIMNLGLWSGATLVTMPQFELGSYLELSERYRVTRAYVVPPIALALARHPAVGQHDLSSLQTIICAPGDPGTCPAAGGASGHLGELALGERMVGFHAEPVRGRCCVITGTGFGSLAAVLRAGEDGRVPGRLALGPPALIGWVAVAAAVVPAAAGCGRGTCLSAARRIFAVALC